jgi:hypothetical protein
LGERGGNNEANSSDKEEVCDEGQQKPCHLLEGVDRNDPDSAAFLLIQKDGPSHTLDKDKSLFN